MALTRSVWLFHSSPIFEHGPGDLRIGKPQQIQAGQSAAHGKFSESPHLGRVSETSPTSACLRCLSSCVGFVRPREFPPAGETFAQADQHRFGQLRIRAEIFGQRVQCRPNRFGLILRSHDLQRPLSKGPETSMGSQGVPVQFTKNRTQQIAACVARRKTTPPRGSIPLPELVSRSRPSGGRRVGL